MRYWWVNQNQTYKAEIRGSFMWSPKQNANGARNQFYENMREVSPGDVVFSFCDTRSLLCKVRQRQHYPIPRSPMLELPVQHSASSLSEHVADRASSGPTFY